MTAQEYFESHSLDQDFLKSKFAVTWDDKSIKIPVYGADAKLLYCRYRHLEGTTKFTSDKGAHPALFAAHKIKKAEQVILCEGEPDCMRLWQEGIPAVTGTTGVKTFSTKIATPLKGKKVIIVLDNDDEGESAIEKYYQVLEEVGATPTIVTLPKEFKDISEYFTAGNTKEDFDILTISEMTLDQWHDEHEPEEYAFETDTELLAQKLEPEEWMVDHILPSEGFAFIVGAEATGKSFYTLTLADAVASGKPWLDAKDKDGKPLFAVKTPQKVLLIDKENTKRRIQSRMKGLSMKPSGNLFWLKYPHYFELSDPNEEDGFSKIAKAASRKVKKEGIKLVIVDSFADVMIGNENAAGDVQKFFDGFRQLFPGCSILVLHHASKPAQGVSRTSAQRARGSTNIMAQIYSGFYVEAVPKSKTEFTLEQTKAGDAEKLNKFMVALKVEPIYEHPGKTLVTALEYKGEVIDQEMKVAEAVEVIEDIFQSQNTVTRQAIMDVCLGEGISEATARRALKQMEEEDVIQSAPDPKNKARKIYIWNGETRANIYEE
jgi:RecA-family ATPase/5S rRNA maturation endonuclease (ribonuclease M5)